MLPITSDDVQYANDFMTSSRYAHHLLELVLATMIGKIGVGITALLSLTAFPTSAGGYFQ